MPEKIAVPVILLIILLLCVVGIPLIASGGGWLESSLARKEDRVPLVVTEDGEVSAVNIFSGKRGPYHLQFFTLEPNSLFLPVLLHADMVLYVHTGSGRLSWTDDGKDMRRVSLRRGVLYRLEPGSVFFLHSNLDTESEREKLRIHAIFTNTREDIYDPAIGAYSSISDLVLGFDTKVLQSAFKVSEDVIDEITSVAKPPAIIHGAPTKKKKKKKKKTPKFLRVLDTRLVNSLVDARSEADEPFDANGHKKTKVFNVFEADPDFQNPNGWSLTVNKGELKSLKGSHVSAFMVNLTRGSMMGPHWNPVATEIGIVLHGEGMVRVVCPGSANGTECKSARFRVGEGDVFAVPRFHPMAQMSFNNDSFVFMGFSTTTKKNHPQFLVGKRSVFQGLNREVLAMSFNVTNGTVIDELFNAQAEEVILRCTSCAEEEESIMEEELEREREEEREREREREQEEEAKRREEDEREQEQEEAAKRREEEEKEREEEAAGEGKRRREEEAMREQEEAKQHEEERARKRREQEEEARRREEEEEEEREPEEEEAGGGEEERDWREQEEARRREEERRRQQEEEEQRQREEEERQMREEMSRRREERQRHEEARRQEEVRWRREEAQREQEEARRQAEERQRRRQPEPWEQEGEEEPQEQEQEYGGGGWRRALRKAAA